MSPPMPTDLRRPTDHRSTAVYLPNPVASFTLDPSAVRTVAPTGQSANLNARGAAESAKTTLVGSHAWSWPPGDRVPLRHRRGRRRCHRHRRVRRKINYVKYLTNSDGTYIANHNPCSSSYRVISGRGTTISLLIALTMIGYTFRNQN